MIAKEIQKPPNEDSAVAPKVLPTAISLYVESESALMFFSSIHAMI